MKKFFTAFALLAIGSAAANAALTFTYKDQPVENGSTILFTAADYHVKDMADPGDGSEFEPFGVNYWEGQCRVMVTGDQPSKIEVTSDRQDLSACLFPGNCFMGQPSGTDYVVTLQPQQTVQAIDVDLNAAMVPANTTPSINTLAKVEVYEGNNVGFTYYVHFDTSNTAVNNATADKAVTVQGNKLCYNVSAPTAVALYSLTGKCVLHATVKGAGSLDLSTLAKGIYVYTAGAHKGKAVVK